MDELRQDDAGQRVEQPGIRHDDEMIDDQRLDRNHEARQDQAPQQVAAGEAELRDGVAAARAHQHDEHGDGRRRDDRIDVPADDLGVVDDVDIGFERESVRPQFDEGPHHLVFRLERGDHQPVERKCPDHRADDAEQRQSPPGDVEAIDQRGPAGRRLGNGGAGAHCSPRALSAWNCSTEAMITITNSATAIVAP